LNLSRIGVAMTLYDQAQGGLPPVPNPPGLAASPFSAMLEALGQPDFVTMNQVSRGLPPARARPSLPQWRIPGLTCPSDPNATSAFFVAPVSYRATTGSTAAGLDGAFALGQKNSIADIASGDGLAYTAAFSERLVGTGEPHMRALGNYAVVAAPLNGSPCARVPTSEWRGDAGSSWRAADWTSTLYNHALSPGGSPSCIAADNRTARIGASSGHVEGVYVLLFDLSARAYAPRVDLKVWRSLASIKESSTSEK
jgi:hypothetical protein